MDFAPLNLMMIGFPGPSELIIIFVIILVLFGGAKLPEMARNLGRGMRVFKQEANALRREIELTETEPKPSASPSPGSEGAGKAQQDTASKPDSSDNKTVEDLV